MENAEKTKLSIENLIKQINDREEKLILTAKGHIEEIFKNPGLGVMDQSIPKLGDVLKEMNLSIPKLEDIFKEMDQSIPKFKEIKHEIDSVLKQLEKNQIEIRNNFSKTIYSVIDAVFDQLEEDRKNFQQIINRRLQ